MLCTILNFYSLLLLLLKPLLPEGDQEEVFWTKLGTLVEQREDSNRYVCFYF